MDELQGLGFVSQIDVQVMFLLWSSFTQLQSRAVRRYHRFPNFWNQHHCPDLGYSPCTICTIFSYILNFSFKLAHFLNTYL